MSDVKIIREDQPTRGRYVATVDGVDDEAELTFSRAGDKLIIADHTGVPDIFRGRGVGHALFLRLVGDARANGVKIVPLCPFVNAERQKYPEWADVFQG